LIASELKIARAFFFESRSPTSSSLASGRPIATPRTRAHARPTPVVGALGAPGPGPPARRKPVLGALAACFATSVPGPPYRKNAEWGRSTRTRRSAGLRPLSGRLPPIIRLRSRPGRARHPISSMGSAALGHVRDHRVLASDERRLQAFGRLVIQHAVPPVPRDV